MCLTYTNKRNKMYKICNLKDIERKKFKGPKYIVLVKKKEKAKTNLLNI